MHFHTAKQEMRGYFEGFIEGEATRNAPTISTISQYR